VKAGVLEYVAKSQEVGAPDRPVAMVYLSKSVLDTDSDNHTAERVHPMLHAPSNYLRVPLDVERVNR